MKNVSVPFLVTCFSVSDVRLIWNVSLPLLFLWRFIKNWYYLFLQYLVGFTNEVWIVSHLNSGDYFVSSCLWCISLSRQCPPTSGISAPSQGLEIFRALSEQLLSSCCLALLTDIASPHPTLFPQGTETSGLSFGYPLPTSSLWPRNSVPAISWGQF